MSASETLKPCPFCGGEAVLREKDDADYRYVMCDTCGIDADNTNTLPESDCAAAWNRRVVERELAAARAESDKYRMLWERDSKSLGVVIGERNTARAVAEDRRAQLAEAERERDALRADAERYRWLVEHTVATGLSRFVHASKMQFLDAAVDAAIDRERAK